MIKVTILAIHNTLATTVMGPMDVFFQSGQLWNFINGIPLTPYFDVEIVSYDGKPVKCLNNAFIQPHRAIDAVTETDLILIPSINDIEKTIRYGQSSLQWLIDHYHRGASIASVCTGAFFLAETGLLDGKTATTHWGFVDQFQQMYPQVNLKPDRIITDEGDLYCAGALGAGIDLSVYLVEKHVGHEVAVQISKALIHDMGRNSQVPYTVFQFQKNHTDETIKASQEWIEENYTREIDFDDVSKNLGMSRRTLERRFKKATGDTPLAYLQRTRVEAAKRKLETSNDTFDQICYQLGYENSSHFRKKKKKHTRLLPTEYQKKFYRI
ncbi:MAG: helix-turn-helix domain-containing protein [Deltaproteobacteria bacterium]|nr:helix-turn-helix domain-containing protein [Deltaproteobacteria bacterium]